MRGCSGLGVVPGFPSQDVLPRLGLRVGRVL
jgi:hypothetical protein